MGTPTTTVSDNQLNLSSSAESGTYKNTENLNVVDPTTASKVTHIYHISEIQQNSSIVQTAKWIIWAGFGVICLGVIFALFGKINAAVLTAVSGIITEIISGVVFAFVSQSGKSKLQYFAQLSMVEEGDKLLAIIETLDKEAKEKQVEKMVDNYCQRRIKET